MNSPTTLLREAIAQRNNAIRNEEVKAKPVLESQPWGWISDEEMAEAERGERTSFTLPSKVSPTSQEAFWYAIINLLAPNETRNMNQLYKVYKYNPKGRGKDRKERKTTDGQHYLTLPDIPDAPEHYDNKGKHLYVALRGNRYRVAAKKNGVCISRGMYGTYEAAVRVAKHLYVELRQEEAL